MANVEYAARGLIGVLTPQANTTVEPEFSILCPPGYGMINARLMSAAAALDDRLLEYFAQLDRAVEQFANAPVDAVALACTGASYLAGVEVESESVARLERKLGVPFITAARAVGRALRTLDARRIGIVSPYPQSLTDKSAEYWRDSGFQVAAVVQVTGDNAAFHPIYSISATNAADGLRAMRDRGLDAVLMLGTGMPTLEPILGAERLIDVPVLSCMLCLAWESVEGIGRDGDLSATRLQRWISGAEWGGRLGERLARSG